MKQYTVYAESTSKVRSALGRLPIRMYFILNDPHLSNITSIYCTDEKCKDYIISTLYKNDITLYTFHYDNGKQVFNIATKEHLLYPLKMNYQLCICKDGKVYFRRGRCLV